MGMRNIVLNLSAGEAIMAHRFLEYAPHKGEIASRNAGVLIAHETGTSFAYSIDKLQDRVNSLLNLVMKCTWVR